MKIAHSVSHFLSQTGTRCISSAFALLFFLLLAPLASAQNTRAELEKQKQELLRKINENQKILDQTAAQRNTSLGRLKALNNQITSRATLIKAINDEMAVLDDEIAEDQSIIEAMDRDLAALKEEYAKMVYATQKTSSGFNKLTFLFASQTFNQLFMRFKYIEQYADARKKQSEQIQIVQVNLNEQIAEIEQQKQDKQALLDEELSENKKLQNLRGEQRQLISTLEKQANKIQDELEKQRASERELTNRIDEIIEAERLAAAASSADMSTLSKEFSDNMGKLPWPVDGGFISSKYGKHRHPTLKRVTLNNKGIDIQTAKDAGVKAVFSGKVVGVMSIQGQGITVLIQHGDYFSAYSRLKAVTVKKGDQIIAGQRLGQVLTNGDNVSELKFRINDKNGTVNPEIWLQSKIN